MAELKPCPFCGSKPQKKSYWDNNWAGYSKYIVKCTNPDCGAMFVEMIHDYEPENKKMVDEFYERWNRRVNLGFEEKHEHEER